MNEIIYAMIDGDGVVKNTIVVGVDWDLGGVPCGEYAVGIGDVYNFTDKKMLKKLGIQQLGIKLTGYNLLTFDKFDIMDPECNPNNADSYPIIKIYNLGINLTF